MSVIFGLIQKNNILLRSPKLCKQGFDFRICTLYVKNRQCNNHRKPMYLQINGKAMVQFSKVFLFSLQLRLYRQMKNGKSLVPNLMENS